MDPKTILWGLMAVYAAFMGYLFHLDIEAYGGNAPIRTVLSFLLLCVVFGLSVGLFVTGAK